MEIARYHVLNLGWPGIGYHYLIHWDGSIDYCQDIHSMSYHIHGHNHDAAGICLSGDWSKKVPNDLMLSATKWLISTLPVWNVFGHKELALPGWETACPGAMWEQWKEKIV